MGERWASRSARRTSLPKEFFRNRELVLRRDARRCRIATPGRCIGDATEVDHIGDRNDHSTVNLRAVCRPCHAQRSAGQGGAAEGRARAARLAARKRPPEPHPGIVG